MPLLLLACAVVFTLVLHGQAATSAASGVGRKGAIKWRFEKTQISYKYRPSLRFVVIDIDQDGDDDVVVFEVSAYLEEGVSYDSRIVAWLNDGRGNFRKARKGYWLKGKPGEFHGMANEQPVVADFNGDSIPDIYVFQSGQEPDDTCGRQEDPCPGAPNLLLLSTRSGRYRVADLQPYEKFDEAYTHHAAAADIDGDGDLDIWDANWPDGAWRPTDPQRAELGPRVLVNDGTGHFESDLDRLPGPFPDLDDPLECGRSGPDCIFPEFTFCDVDGDRDPDLIGQPFADGLYVDIKRGDRVILLNDGTGHFDYADWKLPPAPYGRNSYYASAPVCSDLDLDGDPDILYATHAGFPQGRPHLAFLQNRGRGRFKDVTKRQLPQSLGRVGQTGGSIHIADLNGDGWPDIVLPGENGPRGRVFLTRKKARFMESVLPDYPYDHELYQQVAPIDANGDGKVDLIATGTVFDHRFWLLINEGADGS